MAGKVYTITLDLAGPYDRKLTELEARFAALNNSLGTGAAGTGAPAAAGGAVAAATRGPRRNWRSRYPNISERAWPVAQGMRRTMNQFPGLFDSSGLYRNLNRFGKAQKTFSDNLYRYGFSITGLRRNFGNFVNVLTSFGRVVTQSVPVIGAATAGAKGYLAASALPFAIGGVGLFAGNRLLNNSNLSEATANITQFRAARLGLGPAYDQVYEQASNIAATFGLPRAGLVNAINVFSGLSTNSGPLGINRGIDLARIAGKISQASGRPYDIVSLNLQQLLATASPNSRDIRELIGQAPLISKIALNAAPNMDQREWLRDRDNLLSALYQYDRTINPPAVQAIRGQVGLRRENLWMRIASDLEPFFGDVGGGMSRLYDMIENKVKDFAANYDSTYWQNQFDTFISGMSNIVDLGIWLAENLGSITGLIGQNADLFAGNAAVWRLTRRLPGRAKWGVRAAATGISYAFGDLRSDRAERDEQYESDRKGVARAAIYNSVERSLMQEGILSNLTELGTRASLISDYMNRLPKSVNDSVMNLLGSETLRTPIEPNLSLLSGGPLALPLIAGDALGQRIVNRNFRDRIVPKLSDDQIPKIDSLIGESTSNLVNGIGADGYISGNNDSTGRMVDRMTEGRRSLIINFNREVVQQNLYVNSSSNEQLMVQARQAAEDAVVRGLQIALNNATAM